jgi:hypothetical protein
VHLHTRGCLNRGLVVSAASRFPPEMLEAMIRADRAKLKPGESIVVHDVACPVQVGEACNCEPLVVHAEGEQS